MLTATQQNNNTTTQQQRLGNLNKTRNDNNISLKHVYLRYHFSFPYHTLYSYRIS